MIPRRSAASDDQTSDDQGSASAGDEYVPNSGNGGYTVAHYDLDLTYRVGSNRLSGCARINLRAGQDLSRFSFDLAGLSVAKVSIDGRRVKKFSTARRKLIISPAGVIADGTELTVEIHYAGNPKPLRGNWGEVGWEELTDGAIVAGQPDGAPSWFPCNDHPSSKASYRISITCDAPYRVVSNGTLVSRTGRASQTTWVYEQPEPMASYLATVQIGQYEAVTMPAASGVEQQGAVPGRLRARFARDFGRQDAMMQLFTRRFGPYPYRQYRVVVTDDELEIPLEAQGMSVFGANFLDGERGHERLVAHELAHQWFGNSLTVRSWRHIWLNEGFACYAEWLWSEESGGLSAARLADRYHDRLGALAQDLVIADPGPELMFDDRLYKRGALTLHALRERLGQDAFFELLAAWTAEHRDGNVATADFIAHAQQWSDKPLDRFFHAWLFEPGLPPLLGGTVGGRPRAG